jgi:hypothetical protein
VLTFLLALFRKLAMLFYLCGCPLFMSFSLVLFLLFIEVGSKFGLVPFWGCLSVILCVFVCFIGSFEASRMRLDRFFTYPLTKLFEI